MMGFLVIVWLVWVSRFQAADTNIGLFLVPGKMLDFAQARTVFADVHRRFVGEHALIGVGFDKFSDP